MSSISSKDLAHHPGRLDAGELLVEPLERKRQPLVVDPEQVQDRRVQVTDVHAAVDDVPAVVVGPAVLEARLHAAAGAEPDTSKEISVQSYKNY